MDQIGTVFIELTLDGKKFNAEMKNVEKAVASSSSTMAKDIKDGPGSALDFLQAKFKQLIVITAAAAGFAGFKNLISDSTMLAARVETLSIVTKIVGANLGYSSEQMKSFVNSVKNMGITTQEANQSIARMSSAQLDLTGASKLARIAQDAAVIGNINSSEAFGRMIYAIQSGQPEMLRTLGINVTFERSYATMAAQLGKNSLQLNETEKAQARMNAVMDYGPRIAGAYEASMGTVGKQILSLSRYTEEAKRGFGELFTPLLSVIVEGWTDSLKELTKYFDNLRETGQLQAWANGLTNSVKTLSKEFVMVTGGFIAFIALQKTFTSISTIVTGAIAAETAGNQALLQVILTRLSAEAKLAALRETAKTAAAANIGKDFYYMGASAGAAEGKMKAVLTTFGQAKYGVAEATASIASNVTVASQTISKGWNLTGVATRLFSQSISALGAVFNTALSGMIGQITIFAGIWAAIHFGSKLGWDISGQTKELEKYNRELQKTLSQNTEIKNFLNQKNKLSAALDEEAKKGTPWKTINKKLDLESQYKSMFGGVLPENREATDEEMENYFNSFEKVKNKMIASEMAYNAKLKEEREKGILEVRQKFEKEKPELEFQMKLAGANEFEREIDTLGERARKLWEQYADAGKEAHQFIQKYLDTMVEEATRKQKEEFDKMISGFSIGRQKLEDEASLMTGKMFTVPIGSLMEVDKWLADMVKKYGDSEKYIVQLTKEASDKKLEIIRSWTIKRMEKEKEVLEKLKADLVSYKETLVSVYTEAMSKASEYYQKASSIFSFTSQWSKKINEFGTSPKSQVEQMKADQVALENLVRSANTTLDENTMKQAVEDIGAFLSKYGNVKNFLGGSEIFVQRWKNEANDLIRNLDLMGMGAEQTGSTFEKFAQKQAAAIQTIDQWIVYLEQQIINLDVLVNQTRTMQIDVTQASSNLDMLINKINQAALLTQQINSVAANPVILNTGQSSTPSNFDVAASVAAPAPDTSGADSVPVLGSGTPYVLGSGFAYIDKGEGVLTAKQNKEYSAKKDVSITLGGITINGVNDPEQIARAIVKPLQSEMRRLNILH